MPANEDIMMCSSREFQNEPLLPLFKELTGITIPRQKTMMVASRLRKRLAELGHPTCTDYISMVRSNHGERQTFINLLTTNETSFFRTPRIWKYFRETYLPAFTSANPSGTLRAWSAAASTGEEACSLAISCQEHALLSPGFCYQIFASDVDTEVLARAGKGEFVSRTVDKLHAIYPDLAERYFQPREDRYLADPNLMRHIRFAQHNLMQRPRAIEPSNIVFLRNVLIYFQPAEQTKILHNLASVMAPGTILILGESESIVALEAPFAFVEPQIYRRIS